MVITVVTIFVGAGPLIGKSHTNTQTVSKQDVDVELH